MCLFLLLAFTAIINILGVAGNVVSSIDHALGTDASGGALFLCAFIIAMFLPWLTERWKILLMEVFLWMLKLKH